jgi:hypothetical protein
VKWFADFKKKNDKNRHTSAQADKASTPRSRTAIKTVLCFIQEDSKLTFELEEKQRGEEGTTNQKALKLPLANTTQSRFRFCCLVSLDPNTPALLQR